MLHTALSSQERHKCCLVVTSPRNQRKPLLAMWAPFRKYILWSHIPKNTAPETVPCLCCCTPHFFCVIISGRTKTQVSPWCWCQCQLWEDEMTKITFNLANSFQKYPQVYSNLTRCTHMLILGQYSTEGHTCILLTEGLNRIHQCSCLRRRGQSLHHNVVTQHPASQCKKLGWWKQRARCKQSLRIWKWTTWMVQRFVHLPVYLVPMCLGNKCPSQTDACSSLVQTGAMNLIQEKELLRTLQAAWISTGDITICF